MKISCQVTIEYDKAVKAEKVLRSITVDDVGFVKSTLKGSILTATIDSASVSSLLHTLDDYLACLSVAEKIVDKN